MAKRLRSACRHLAQSALKRPQWYLRSFEEVAMARGCSSALAALEDSRPPPPGDEEEEEEEEEEQEEEEQEEEEPEEEEDA
eukprot:8022933-Alexandrium_andersonii.AAC.1